MKKNLLILALAFITLGASAQQQENRDANNKILRGPYQTNRFFDNVFIQAGVGASVYLGGQNGTSFGNRIRPVYEFSVGKWITPTVGVRLQFNYSDAMRQYSSSHTSPYTIGAGRLQKFNFANLHADFMYNLSAAIGGYRENRVYEIVPYLGFGWAHIGMPSKKHNNEIAFNFGLLNKFRVSKTIDLNLEMRSTMIHGNFDMSSINNQLDIPVAVSVGVTIRLGKVKGFKRAEAAIEPNYVPYINLINNLTADSTKLSNKNKELNNEIEELRNRKPETVVGETITSASPVALFFAIGKETLDKKELVNLDFYVKNAIKADKNKTFTLIGSADNATGNKEVNQKLSEQRMQYIYDLLVNKYGISKERLLKKAEGDTNNRFAEPELNRVVIVE